MKNYIFHIGKDEIKESGSDEFTGIGQVKISGQEGELVVLCYQIDGGFWRVALTPSGYDEALPEWRSTYSIEETGVMNNYIIHVPGESTFEVINVTATINNP